MDSPRITPPAAKRPRTARVGERGERTMLACIGCKQRKLKCDGQSPRCQNCIKTNRDCLVEDPATGLHRPRDYLKSLETRVAYLESLLQQVRPDVALDHMGSIDSSNESRTLQAALTSAPNNSSDILSSHQATDVTFSLDSVPIFPIKNNNRFVEEGLVPDHGGSIVNAPQMARPRRPSSLKSEDQQVDVLSAEVALLCLSATGRDPHYFGPSSAVSFSRIVSATMGLPTNSSINSGSQCSVRSEGEVAPLPISENDAPLRLPSAAVAEKLTKAYFNNIHPQYPFLHRPTFETWESVVRNDSQLETHIKIPNVPLYFVLMVYAVGSLVLGQHHSVTAEKYYATALSHLPPILEQNSLESIQGILCCAVYSIRSPIGVSLWKISGMAIRHCVELGYHRSAECYRGNADTLTKEMIKRCFWVAYDIDRVAAYILGRPVGIPEESIDVEVPADIDDENITPNGFSCNVRTSTDDPPTTMTGALHVVKLRRLWARFNDCLYSKKTRNFNNNSAQETTVSTLREELEEWRSSLPSQLDFAQSNPLSVFASSEWFRLAYDHSILLLYRPFITASVTQRRIDGTSPAGFRNTDDEGLIDHAFDECAKCAREMCLLYRRLYQSSSIQFTWGSLHILFLGGLTYLYCLWRSRRVRERTKQTDVVSTCIACSTVLVIIAERWNLATSYRDLFETLSEKTISMVCGDGDFSDPSRAPPEGEIEPLDDSLFRDWINSGIDDLAIPQESEWLVQELLHGGPQWSVDGF